MKNVWVYFLLFYSLSGFTQLAPSKSKQDQESTSNFAKIDSNLISIPQLLKPPAIYTKYQPYKRQYYAPSALLIDSFKVSDVYIMYIDPVDVYNVNTKRNKEYPNGVIYVTLKDHKILSKLLVSKLLSLKDITNTYVIKKEKPIIFLLNKELVTDTTGVRIPEICLGNITVAEADQMPYFKTTFPNALIMMITTHPISNKPYQPDILIRGKVNN